MYVFFSFPLKLWSSYCTICECFCVTLVTNDSFTQWVGNVAFYYASGMSLPIWKSFLKRLSFVSQKVSIWGQNIFEQKNIYNAVMVRLHAQTDREKHKVETLERWQTRSSTHPKRTELDSTVNSERQVRCLRKGKRFFVSFFCFVFCDISLPA